MNYNKICAICGSEFKTNIFNKITCSDKCSKENKKELEKKYKTKDYKPKDTKNRICKKCGNIFNAKSGTQEYCSAECRKKELKKFTKVKCYVCNKYFTPKTYNQKLCSKECKNINNKLYREKYYKKIEIEKTCEFCKTKFLTKKNNAKFCSKQCVERNSLEYQKKYRIKNKEKNKKKYKEWYQKNKEKALKYNKDNRKKILEYEKTYRKDRKKIDPAFKLKYVVQNRLRSSLKDFEYKKNFRTFKLLEYTPLDLKISLESKFQKGMTWENHGNYGWHIDHIKPINAFKLIKDTGELDLEQIKLCWSLDNLQPLWAKDNMSKGSWYEVDGKMCRFSNGEIVEVREDFN